MQRHEHRGELNWTKADEWARGLKVSFCTDFSLPSKLDGMVLWANLRKEFKQAAYWLEQHAEGSYDACYQRFGGGFIDWAWKSNGLRARCVRKIPIQPFSHSTI